MVPAKFYIPRARYPNEIGAWRPLRVGARWSASVICPECGQLATLDGHAIADDGTVTPSCDCPSRGCPFHEHVRLKDWPPGSS